MDERPYLSLVIPAYNEQENIEPLLARIEGALVRVGRPFEVIIVDDGSTDRTPQLLREAMIRLPWLRVLRMARNGGRSAACEGGVHPPGRAAVARPPPPSPQAPPGAPPRLPPLEARRPGLARRPEAR